MIFDLLKNTNNDCSFTDKIIESEYIEKIYVSDNKCNMNSLSLVSCIIMKYDPIYNHIPENEKKFYIKKIIPEICSKIEENSELYYHNYKFNEKIMKISTIQYGLQASENKMNYISSLYYLNEYYKRNFVIIYNNSYYETTIKNTIDINI